MSLFDVQVPFFIPVWRRVAVTVFTLAWALVELLRGEVFWAIFFGAAGAYLVHQFFIAWTLEPPKDDDAT